MQILGIDIGFSRTGFAIGDTITGIAFPREIVSYSTYLKTIHFYLSQSEEKIGCIVVGMPQSLSGGNSNHMQKISAEIEKIKILAQDFSVPVETYDEQFTSKIAENSLYTMGYSAKQQKGKKDNIAATIILQGFLDSFDFSKVQ